MIDLTQAIGDVTVPDTATARAAAEVSAEYCEPDLLHHSLRSYYWGAWWGDTAGLTYDAELLFVAAALHDLSLTAPFDSHSVDFEEAGGHLARVFTAGAGWSRARRDRVAEVIVLHMRDDVPETQDVESHLLQIAVSADVSGKRLDRFDDDYVTAVLDALPRLDFASAFVARFRAQAVRKRGCAAAELVAGDWPDRVLRHPYDRRG